MRKWQNERGGALLMVLLLLVILSIFGILAFTLNSNANKQFDKKEANVQARYLAEMGVLHYRDVVDNEVSEYNASEDYLVYETIEGKEVLNIEKSKEKYNTGLCEIANTVSVPTSELETGKYSFTGKQTSCSSGKIELTLNSIGESNKGGNYDITATITIAPVEGGGGNEEAPPEENSSPPPIPAPLGDNVRKVSTLDGIHSMDSAVRVDKGTSRKANFNTNAAVEVLGSMYVQKETDWKFYYNLYIHDSFNTDNNRAKLEVFKDLYIGEELNLGNHGSIIVRGDFFSAGLLTIDTKSSIIVDGNAVFSSKLELADTHSNILIGENAYFSEPIGNFKNEARICVQGTAYLKKDGSWSPYLKTDAGYQAFDQSCFGTPPEEPVPSSNGDFDWRVYPSVDAEYNIGLIKDEDTTNSVFILSLWIGEGVDKLRTGLILIKYQV